MALTNILRNALRPAYASEMAHKLKLRLLNRVDDPKQRARSTAWCEQVAEDASAFARARDPGLWSEATAFGAMLEEQARRTLANEPFLGGGGHYPLLYFLTRYHKPQVIVETGVAAGFSSAAFLTGISRNGRGHLYSSDFPYFRLANPEQYVGALVDHGLRRHWTLLLRGDRINVPEILGQVAAVDLFHYDSDKTYSGRAFAMTQVAPRLAPDGIVVMDDIADNMFFHDYVHTQQRPFRVVGFERKVVGYVGIVGA